MARRTRTRKILYGAGAGVLVLLILIAFLPAMVSAGLFHGTIRNTLSANVNGEVSFQQLRVSWFGPQEIRGLTVTDEHGREAIVADASATPSLFALLFGMTSMEADIAGVARGDLYEDGTTSFQRLFITDPDKPEEPPSLEGVPATLLRVQRIDVFLHDVAARRDLVLSDLRGEMAYRPGDRIDFDLRGETTADELRGSMELTGSATGLFNARGRFTPHNAPMNIVLAGRNMPVPGIEVQSELQSFELRASSQNMAELIALHVSADASIQDEPPSRFRGEVRLTMPFKEDGTLDISLDRLAGELSGERVPSSLLQPFMPEAVVLTRDVGPTVDLDVQITEGLDGAAVVRASGERAQLELTARQENGWWRGERLLLTSALADPALVHGLTNIRTAQPTDVRIELASFGMPPVDEALGRRPLSQWALTGSLAVNGPVEIVLEGEEPDAAPRRITLENAQINIDSPALGERLDVRGEAQLDGAPARLEHTITRLFNAAGEMDVMNADIVGELSVSEMPVTTLAQWLPEQEELINELLGEHVNATLTTRAEEEGLQAELGMVATNAQGQIAVLRAPDALRVQQGRITSTMTPGVFARFAPAGDDPIALAAPARVQIDIDPFDIPGRTFEEYDFTAIPARGRLQAEDLALENVPGFNEALGLTAVRANFAAQLGETAEYHIDGTAQVTRPGAAAPGSVAAATFDITATPLDEGMEARGTLNLAQLSVTDAETMLGWDAGAISDWTGDSGNVNATFAMRGEALTATLVSELPRLRGTFDAGMENEVVSFSTESAEITLAAAVLQALLAQDAAAMEQRVSVSQDVPMRLVVNAKAPLAMLVNEPVDAALMPLVDITASLTGGPLAMTTNGQQSTLRDIRLDLRSEATSLGVDFIVAIDMQIDSGTAAPADAAAQRGGVEMRGTVREALRPNEALGFERAVLDMNATLTHAPTALVDALFPLRGYLVAAIGPHMDAEVIAQEFSRESGEISLEATAPNGSIRGRAVSRDGVLTIAEGSPIEAELEITPVLRDALLKPLNPLMGDIVTAQQRLRASFANATIPLDGDVSKLGGNISINIGEVRFDPASPFVRILQLARVGDEAGLGGRVEPVNASIREGVIRYDRFRVHIDRVAFPFAGEINLATRRVNLSSPLPLGEIIHGFGPDLPDVVRAIEVPVVTTGSFDSPQVRPDFSDPSFLGRMAEAGLRDRIGDILPPELRDLIPRPRR